MVQNTENLTSRSFSRISSYQNTRTQPVEINSSSSKVENINLAFNDVSSAEIAPVALSSSNSILEQRFSYIEFPLEINYGVFQSPKFSFYLSGGFSTLFLTSNKIQLENEALSISQGEATNLNDLNFSLNLGTDIEYHLSEKWFLNINPSLKIQTQTFNKNSNRPYLLGVSSGINYKF
jgi:hypothetical protein